MVRKNDPSDIFRLLDSVGLSKSYVSSLLPGWWDDQAASNTAGLSEFKLLLSRNLGVDIEGLSADEPELKFRLPHVRRLKRSVKYDETQLTPAVSISLSAARMAIAACTKEYRPLPSAMELRKVIFDAYKAKYVSLRALIRTCWDHGIPVIHVSGFPDGMPKMDGMVVSIKERPAIVLAKQTQFQAWMAFILAHEMGHLSNGHCSNGEMLVDESLDETSLKEGEGDKEEREADQYALVLLAGDEELAIDFPGTMKPKEISRYAMDYHRQHRVDAGHVILNYAYRSGEWQRSIAALKVLDDKKRAIPDIVQAMMHELDPQRLSDTSLAFLFKMCGVKAEAA